LRSLGLASREQVSGDRKGDALSSARLPTVLFAPTYGKGGLLHERGIEFHDIKLAYQSKVGSSDWLEPNLADVLRNPTHRKVIIYPLAFTIDNSETVFELDIEHREIAQKVKYDDYIVVKCLNDSDRFVDLIVKKVEHA